jgi:hypothetical protein
MAFKVLTMVVMKRSVFWDTTLCGLIPVICFHVGFFLDIFFETEDGRDTSL